MKAKSMYNKKAPSRAKKYGQKRRSYAVSKAIYKKNRDESGAIKSIASELGSIAGQAVAGPLGSIAGGALGSLFDRGITYFTGKGAYQVKKNVFLQNENMPPIINKDPSKGVLIRRTEYVTDIISSATPGAFNIQSFYINPGLSNTFSWLGAISSNWSEWVAEGIYFSFRSTSANALNSTNTALGQVILACDYNASNPPFTSKQEMENYEGGISVKPSQNVNFFVECAKNRSVLTELYVRTGAVPSGQDQHFYDLGNFQIATNGMQAGSISVGELFVTYQIALRKPKMFTALGNSNLWCASSSSTFSNASPFGSQIINDGNLTLTFTGNTITFPYSSVTQSYYVQILWFGTSTVVSNFATVTFGTGLLGPYRTASVPGNGETVSKMSYSFEVQVPANNLLTNNVITIGNGGTYPTGTQSVYIVVNQMPNLYFNAAL